MTHNHTCMIPKVHTYMFSVWLFSPLVCIHTQLSVTDPLLNNQPSHCNMLLKSEKWIFCCYLLNLFGMGWGFFCVCFAFLCACGVCACNCVCWMLWRNPLLFCCVKSPGMNSHSQQWSRYVPPFRLFPRPCFCQWQQRQGHAPPQYKNLSRDASHVPHMHYTWALLKQT